MSEQSTGKAESEPIEVASAPPAQQPVPQQRPPQESQPIEVGDGPFGLTGSDDGDDEPERIPPSRTRKIVLSSLLAISLAGAGVIGYTGWGIASQKDATLTVPPQVPGLTLDSSASGIESAEYLRAALSAEVDLDKTVGAVYKDTGSTDQGVLFFGGTTLIWTPGSDLETAFGLVSDDRGAVEELHDVDAGELGGTMKCGTTKSEDSKYVVCGWADHGSLALAMFPNRPEAEAAGLLREIRAAAQTRK